MFASLIRGNASAGPSRLGTFSPASPSSAPSASSSSLASDGIKPEGSPLPQPISSALRARAPPKLPQSVIEKNYTGPDRASLPAQRTRSQAEKYFARVANENVAPGRWSKALSIGGWVLGAFACGYMALVADFGEHEHVFSPLRRQFRSFTNDLVTLSPAERSVLGLDAPDRAAAVSDTPLTLEGSLRDPRKRPT